MASARPGLTCPAISLAIARPAVELGRGWSETVASMRMGRLSLGTEVPVGWECSSRVTSREAAGIAAGTEAAPIRTAIRDGATAGKAALVVGEP